MKNNIFTQIKKNTFSHNVLALFMVFSLLFQNAGMVQYAYASELETVTSNTVSTQSTDIEHEEEHVSVESSVVVTERSSHESETHVTVTTSGDEHHEYGGTNEGEDHHSDSSSNSDEHDTDIPGGVNPRGDRDDKEDGHHGTIKDILHDFNTAKPKVTIIATSVVCDDESKLPNWGLGGPDITSSTAADYVAAHTGCTLATDWNFQWGFSSVRDLSGDFVGEANGSMGQGTNTGTGLADWKTFGPSNANGVAMTTICDLEGSPKIWVREVLKEGYVPFTYDPTHPTNSNNVSAELYCNADVLNYDNYDYISAPALGTTYHCVGFNVKKPAPHVNTAPVITVVGSSSMSIEQGSTYVDLKATVLDAEDGDITAKLVSNGTVNTAVLGTYTITYNATDTQNLAAIEKTRVVNVVPKSGCTTNCPVPNTPPVITVLGLNPMTIFQNTVFADPGATAFDLEDATITPSATGTVNTAVIGSYVITYTAIDSKGATAAPKTRTVNVVPAGTPINQKPEITLLGNIVMELVIGTPFVDPSATVADPEDGNITNKLVATGTVDVNTLGAYVITYNATDSKNLAADPKIRTVNVVQAPVTGCTTNCGGGSATSPYPGCMNPAATNYNSLANKDDGSCKFPGGGVGGSVPLTISNEKLTVTGTTTVTVTWNTNLPADSRVVYGDKTVGTVGAKPFYGYPLTTATDTTSVYNHSMVISGIPSAMATYFRPVSSNVSETVVGIELTRKPEAAAPLACEYLKEYLRLGANNNPTEVTKLQLFLKNYDGAANLQVTGFFDVTTDKAVRSFQDKYKKDVLEAWNLPSNTGYVYYTTKKKINEIYCQREFPLSAEQTTEIASFRALINRINAVGTASTEVLPLVGTNKTSGSVAGANTVKTTPVTVSVTPTTEKTTNGAYAKLDAQAVKATTEGTPESRGRIAIADLLATAPSIAEDITSGSESEEEMMKNGTGTEIGVVASTGTKRNLLAAVSNSLSSRWSQCSPSTIYFTLIFLILALVFATLYFRKTIPAKVSNEEAAGDE